MAADQSPAPVSEAGAPEASELPLRPADSEQSAQQPASEAQKLYDDPVTGEKISKSELKRRDKQRKVAKEKEAKAQAKPQAKSAKPAANAEDELNPSVGDAGCPRPFTFR